MTNTPTPSNSVVTEAMLEAGQLAIARMGLATAEPLVPRDLCEAIYLAMQSANPTGSDELVERVARSLSEQMENEEAQSLPSSMQRDKGLVWLEGWFDLRAALNAMRQV